MRIHLPTLARRLGLWLSLWLSVVAGSLSLTAATATSQPLHPDELMIFYAWPGRGMGPCGGCFPEGDNAAHRAAEFGVYDYLVLGAGLELDTHPEHALVTDMIGNPAMASTDVFGYVDLGVTTSNFSLGEILDRMIRWRDMGAAGIFLDDFGYDFGTTRSRQNTAVGYAHALGMSVMANAFRPADAFGNAIDPAHNPTGAATALGSNDYYLYESHGIRLDVPESLGNWWAKTQELENYRASLGFGIVSTTTKAYDSAYVYDEQQFFFAWMLAAMAGHTATAYSEYSFSAAGNSNGAHIYRERPTLGLGSQWTGPIEATANGFRRPSDAGWAQVDFTTTSHAMLTGSVTVAPAASEALRLGPAFPNPFNPRTRVDFTLGQPEEVQAALFDLRGRRVRVLARGSFEAGDHRLEWDGTDDRGRPVASGSYRLVIRTARGNAQTRFTLVR